MPRMFKAKNLAAQRKRTIANALGLRVKPTGSLRRAAQMQVIKRKAVIAKGLPASATGRFRIKDYQAPQSARERQMGTRMVEEERELRDSEGHLRYGLREQPSFWGGTRTEYGALTEKVQVPKPYEIAPARSAIPASIRLKKISQTHNSPRVSGKGTQKTFGGIKENGKRGTFKSRKSKRRL
jgi:hypothetical protein